MILKVLIPLILAIASIQAAILDPNVGNPGPTDPFNTNKPIYNYNTTTRVPAPPPMCSYNGYWLNCSNFNTFSDLNLTSYRPQELLIISPPVPLDLDENFDLTGFDTKYSAIRFANINSFPFLADQTKNVKSGKGIYVKKSKLSFTYAGKPVSQQCNSELSEKIDADHLPFFSAFKQISFEDSNEISEPLCPLLFKGGNFSSFATKQPLSFIQLNEEENLNVHVGGFDISDCTFSLSTQSVSPQIFKGITSMRTYQGVIEHIEEDFFKHFPSLKYMRLQLKNMGDFFRNVNPAWMKNANYLINVDFNDPEQVQANRNKDLLITFEDLSGSYQFPDEDFCIFKDFPHHKMLFFQIDTTASKVECSCTLYWLHKHKKYKNFDYPIQPFSSCFTADKFNSSIEACKFEERLAQCANPISTTTRATTTTQSTTITHTTATTPTRPITVPTLTTPRPVPTNVTNTYKSGLIKLICNNCHNIIVNA